MAEFNDSLGNPRRINSEIDLARLPARSSYMKYTCSMYTFTQELAHLTPSKFRKFGGMRIPLVFDGEVPPIKSRPPLHGVPPIKRRRAILEAFSLIRP